MTNTRKMVIIASLSAISFILMLFNFPIIPAASFLKIDFSIIPMLTALVLFDLKSSYLVLFFRSLLKILLDGKGVNDFIGLPMNIVAIALFLFAFALFWKKSQTKSHYMTASIIGTALLTLAMLLLNLFYAVPLYAKFANFDIAKFIGLSKYLFTMVLPFNFIEGLIFAIVFYFVYIAIKPILERYH